MYGLRSFIFLLGFLFSSLVLIAQPAMDGINQTDDQGRKHGPYRKMGVEGKVRYEGYFEHGIPKGTFRHYYDDGQLMAENVYSVDGKQSRAVFYHPGAIRKAEGKFIQEQKDSIWIYYNEKGEKISQSNYKNGKLNGPSTTYFANGSVCEELNYLDGQKEGAWKGFFENGKLKEEGQFSKNLLVGKVVYYHPSGEKSGLGKYEAGVKSGEWFYYDENGIPTFSEVFRNGVPQSKRYFNGEFEEQFPNGTPKNKFQYKNGKKDGPFVEYHETAYYVLERVEAKDGYPEEVVQKLKGLQKKLEGNYKAGLEEGLFIYYSKDGKVEKKVNYSAGKATGK
jgi:antitoxin component YwqK of YwqJK toxin-antitoxin module